MLFAHWLSAAVVRSGHVQAQHHHDHDEGHVMDHCSHAAAHGTVLVGTALSEHTVLGNAAAVCLLAEGPAAVSTPALVRAAADVQWQ